MLSQIAEHKWQWPQREPYQQAVSLQICKPQGKTPAGQPGRPRSVYGNNGLYNTPYFGISLPQEAQMLNRPRIHAKQAICDSRTLCEGNRHRRISTWRRPLHRLRQKGRRDPRKGSCSVQCLVLAHSRHPVNRLAVRPHVRVITAASDSADTRATSRSLDYAVEGTLSGQLSGL